jgi:DNA topoisomerase I
VPARSKAASTKAAAADNGAEAGNHAAGNGGGNGTRLVIVESPAKARTIAGYLGKGYVVEPSIGHIRDMPDSASQIPPKYKEMPWARLGVDVDNDFSALYVVPPEKKQQVTKLKALLKDADELYLATDEDREGEAIAWHLLEELKPKVPARRMVFHEITPEAIARAIANPTQLNNGKVDAYQTRRVLDRLYGYEVSPVLWKKITRGLSAGRVQSVATRLVVDKERERIAFRSAGYWDLEAEFATRDYKQGELPDVPSSFTATLISVDGKRVAQGRDFSSTGELRDPKNILHLDAGAAAALAARLNDAAAASGTPIYEVSSVERKPYRRSPYPPFRTTTLQQEASRKLGFSAKYTMSVAQRLYENGFITYMRTDSITLSQTAIDAARAQARDLFGAEYVPDAPRTYTSKVKNAQEAHEAIRPAGDRFRTPQEAQRSGLKGDEYRLYELVWRRTVACQMKDATGESVSVRVVGTSTSNERAEFGASGKIINFYGFLKAYVESTDDNGGDRDDQERRLPPLAEHDPLSALRLGAAEHATRAPARYTEASLVKELEDREIGRPSTYASIIGTILDRGYVFKKGTALVPSFLAFAVVTLLERHFGKLVDYEFTAEMEDALDEIARGEAERVPWLKRFYFGEAGTSAREPEASQAEGDDADANGPDAGGTDANGPESAAAKGLKALVSNIGEIDARDVSSFPLAGTDIVVRVGRYGPYLEREGQRANVPEDMAPDELTLEKAEELLNQPSGDYPLGNDPATGRPIVAKAGRFGPYVTEQLPEDSKDKPRTASLLKSMALDTVTLDDALKLLSLPRTLGELEGEPVTVQNGRYGPYVKHGTESRSLASEEEMFTVTLAEAKDLLAQPKPRGRGRAAAAPPLKELGDDPATGKPMVIKDGRFGPYVTDGETNASLRKADNVETITPQRGAELLAERRAAAPSPRAKRTAPTAKSPAKTSSKTSKSTTTAAKPATASTAKKSTSTAKKTTTGKSPTGRKATDTPGK